MEDNNLCDNFSEFETLYSKFSIIAYNILNIINVIKPIEGYECEFDILYLNPYEHYVRFESSRSSYVYEFPFCYIYNKKEFYHYINQMILFKELNLIRDRAITDDIDRSIIEEIKHLNGN